MKIWFESHARALSQEAVGNRKTLNKNDLNQVVHMQFSLNNSSLGVLIHIGSEKLVLLIVFSLRISLKTWQVNVFHHVAIVFFTCIGSIWCQGISYTNTKSKCRKKEDKQPFL